MALSEIIALLRQKDKILYPITQLKNVTDDAEAKTAPADADSVPIADSADSGQMKKVTWSNIKTALSSLFAAKSHKHSTSDVTGINGISITGTAEKVGSPIATKFLSSQTTASRTALQEKGGFAAGYLTSSATDGPPGTDHAALALSYDNAKWSVMIAGDWRTGKLYVSTRNSGTWGAWKEVAYTDAATTSAAGLMSSADKTKLDDIAAGANKYTHPAYTARTSGLYKITVDATGHVSAVTAVTKADITALGIPAQDTNTTYSTMKGASASAAGATGLVPAPAAGKQTSFLRGDGTWVVPTNTTYANMKGATASAAGTAGLVPAPSAGAATRYLRSDGTWAVPPDTNTTYSNMSGATTSAAGKAGLVPAPAAGTATRYLRSDGTWAVPPDTNTTYTLASFGVTATAAELNKLDGVTATATEINYVDGVTSNIQTQLNGKLSTSGTAAAATKLATARTIQTNLGSTSAVSFNGTANVTPGITGTLAVAHGGTGATTAAAALKNLGLTAVFGVDSTGPYIKEL